MQYIPCCPPNIRENYLNCNIRFNEFSVININFTNVKRPKIRASLHIVLGSNKSAGTHNCSKLCITQFLLHSNLIIWFKILPFWKSVIFQKSIYPKWNHKLIILPVNFFAIPGSSGTCIDLWFHFGYLLFKNYTHTTASVR